MSRLVSIGDLSSLKITLPPINVTQEAIDERIEMVLRDKAIKAPSDEAIAKGDNVYLSFTGKTVDGKDFKGSHGENMAGEIGTEDFIKEFNEALPGHKAGDQMVIEVETDDEFHIQASAGLSLVFNVKVERVMKDVLPTLDDYFVQSLNLAGIKDVKTFRNFAERALTVDKLKENEILARNTLIKSAVSKGVYEITDQDIAEEANRLVVVFNEKLLYQGLVLDEYLESKGMTREDLALTYHKDAVTQIKIRLLFEHLEEVFGIVLTDEDLEKEVEALKEEHNYEIGDLIRMSPKHKEKFASSVIRRRVVEALMTRTKINYTAE